VPVCDRLKDSFQQCLRECETRFFCPPLGYSAVLKVMVQIERRFIAVSVRDHHAPGRDEIIVYMSPLATGR